ncbi:hypothetical protein, variant 3 [Aphanomyces astaci]|uniref:MI domain-containing protein n=1 Tax=Aphanomyces astaci TaxID=112090 RepID=W4HCA0_APHAT|nr:hypothetical protein, variant 2 [Aphanomyces astaci]XP_009821943.1 hypothetical protein, variant 3 [Aphanomyces astaci]ETV89542.1 hypothetical protein, variant 2 [Aphanomyces astaci]ETV89543.1 hypothetical protein, variant 3 [Aphanomyces astaci]|eukprot:XP_009821942.1 hypothetical protein, variant 2 [Aphanomyces astaci]
MAVRAPSRGGDEERAFDAELILFVPEEERVAVMVEACSKHSRSFVAHVYRPFLSYALQHPHATSLPALLRRFLEEVDLAKRVSMIRIGWEELEKVLAANHDNNTVCVVALESFLATCPMQVESMVDFIERTMTCDLSKDVRKQVMQSVYRCNLSDDAKRWYFVQAMQLESTRYVHQESLMSPSRVQPPARVCFGIPAKDGPLP